MERAVTYYRNWGRRHSVIIVFFNRYKFGWYNKNLGCKTIGMELDYFGYPAGIRWKAGFYWCLRIDLGGYKMELSNDGKGLGRGEENEISHNS